MPNDFLSLLERGHKLVERKSPAMLTIDGTAPLLGFAGTETPVEQEEGVSMGYRTAKGATAISVRKTVLPDIFAIGKVIGRNVSMGGILYRIEHYTQDDSAYTIFLSERSK